MHHSPREWYFLSTTVFETPMRILAFTDIHGSYKTVEEILRWESGFDAVIIGGDLTTYGSPGEAEDAIKRFQSFGRPLLVVAGNMDPPRLEDTFNALGVSIDGKGRVINDVGFFGVSASPFTPMNTPYEISEGEIGRRAEAGWNDLQSARIRIFIPHAPPRDTKVDRIMIDMHVGSTAVRAFIERRQPDAVVCGHIHEARGQDMIGTTKIINCGPAEKGYYAVVNIEDTVTIESRG